MSFPVGDRSPDPLRRRDSIDSESGGLVNPVVVQDSYWLGRFITKSVGVLGAVVSRPIRALFGRSPPTNEVNLHIDQMRAAHQQFLRDVSPQLPAPLPGSSRLEIPVPGVDDIFAKGAPVAAVLDRLNGYDHYEWGHVGVKLSREVVERAEQANYSPGDQLKIVNRLIEKMDEVEEVRFRKHIHIRKGPLLDLKYKLLAANPRLPGADREKASISEAVLNHLKFMIDSLGSSFPGGRALLQDRMAEVYYDMLKNPEADEDLRDRCHHIRGLG